jgi:hypothetical protein
VRALRISDARYLGVILKAEGVVVIAWRPGANPDRYAMASWGRTKAKCAALGKFLDGQLGTCIEAQGPDL